MCHCNIWFIPCVIGILCILFLYIANPFNRNLLREKVGARFIAPAALDLSRPLWHSQYNVPNTFQPLITLLKEKKPLCREAPDVYTSPKCKTKLPTKDRPLPPIKKERSEIMLSVQRPIRVHARRTTINRQMSLCSKE